MAHDARPQSQPKYDPHYAAIGRVTETWAQLEFYIDQSLWALTAVRHALGACVTSQLIGVNGRMRALRSLVAAHGGSDALQKKINRFANDLGSLQTKRNRAVHDPRLINRSTGEMDRLQITAEGKLDFGWKPETPESLMEIREEIGERINEFQRLHAEIIDELRALPDEDRPLLPEIKMVALAGLDQTTGKG